MGASASAQLPDVVDAETLRRLGGACYQPEAFSGVPDPDAVPRMRVVGEVIKRGLDAHGVLFWQNLRHFFTVRRGLDETWAQVPNREALETGIEASDRLKKADGAYDGALRQQALGGGGRPVRDLDELYAAAGAARAAFAPFLAGATASFPEGRKGVVAPLKKRKRAADKAAEDYGRRDPGPPEAWLFDVVRGKAVCETGDEVLAVWNALRASPGVEVVRVKNRCAKPKFNGYRDFLINLRVRIGGEGGTATSTKVATATGHAVTTVVSGAGTSFAAAAPTLVDELEWQKLQFASTLKSNQGGGAGGGACGTGAAWHVCELQLHIKQITDAEKALRSHVAYEYFRAYFSGNDAAVKQRLDVLLEFGEAAETPKDMVDRVLAASAAADGAADGGVGALEQVRDLMKAMAELELQGRVCRAIAEKQKAAHGEGSGEHAVALNELALLLKGQGKYDEALPLFKQALEVAKTPTGMSNLANLLREQGHYDEAIPYAEEALAIRKKEHRGNDHPDVAESMNNLAMLLEDQGHSEEAREYFLEALAIWKKAFGNEHPKVATTMNNLAALLQAQGHFEEAIQFAKQSLAIRKRAYGAGHPKVATPMHTLAVLLKKQGNAEEAARMGKEALQILEEALGADHPRSNRVRSWWDAAAVSSRPPRRQQQHSAKKANRAPAAPPPASEEDDEISTSDSSDYGGRCPECGHDDCRFESCRIAAKRRAAERRAARRAARAAAARDGGR